MPEIPEKISTRAAHKAAVEDLTKFKNSLEETFKGRSVDPIEKAPQILSAMRGVVNMGTADVGGVPPLIRSLFLERLDQDDIEHAVEVTLRTIVVLKSVSPIHHQEERAALAVLGMVCNLVGNACWRTKILENGKPQKVLVLAYAIFNDHQDEPLPKWAGLWRNELAAYIVDRWKSGERTGVRGGGTQRRRSSQRSQKLEWIKFRTSNPRGPQRVTQRW
jgi:hypothetical protein